MTINSYVVEIVENYDIDLEGYFNTFDNHAFPLLIKSYDNSVHIVLTYTNSYNQWQHTIYIGTLSIVHAKEILRFML